MKYQAGEGEVGLLGLVMASWENGCIPERHAETWHPGAVLSSAHGCESPRALLAEATDDIARILAGELHCAVTQAAEAFVEVGHRAAVVAVFLGRAAEELSAEAFERLLKLLITSKVQRAEVVDERGEAVERALMDAVAATVDGGQNLTSEACCFFT